MIAVLMPYKNSAKTVEETLASLAAQTHKDFILVAVNNNSTDWSERIIANYCEENLISCWHMRCEENGIVPALNTGLFWILRESEFKFVARLDSDDIWLPEKLEKQINFLNENKDIAILGTQIETFFDGEGGPVQITHPTSHEEIVETLFNVRNCIAHPSVMIRSEVFKRCGVYDDIYRHCEDYQYWIKASRHFRLANLPDVLVRYRSHYNPNYNPAIPVMCKMFYGKAVREAIT